MRPTNLLQRRPRGFSLLEVLVAVAILGLGLTAILSAQAGAFSSAAYARNVSVATGLLRCKMSEVEEHLYKDGFQEIDESGAGLCCEGDENPDFRCAWRVERPQFPEARFGDLNLGAGLDLSGSGSPAGGGLGALGLLAGAAPGGSPMGAPTSVGDVAKTLADANAQANAMAPPPPGAPSGSPPGTPGSPTDPNAGAGNGMGGLASMAMSLVYPSLKLLFEASTRRITATVIFREGKQERSIEVVEWFTIPQKGLTVDDQSAQDTTGPVAPIGTTPRTTPKGGGR